MDDSSSSEMKLSSSLNILQDEVRCCWCQLVECVCTSITLPLVILEGEGGDKGARCSVCVRYWYVLRIFCDTTKKSQRITTEVFSS